MSLSDQQRSAIDIATSGRIGILTGGPGTGKTYTIAHYLDQCSGRILLCAPTGKAAIRMNESLGYTVATTVHRMMEPVPTSHGWVFQRGPDNLLDADLIVGDEWSMTNANLFASMVQAIPDRCRLLLVGDPDQLPPVGHGKPLLDMIRSKLIPHGHLSEPHRFAGRIANVCHVIKHGEMPQFSEKIDLGADSPENCKNITVESTQKTIGRILGCFDRIPAKYGEIDPQEDIQLIVPRNDKTPFNRTMFNKILKRKLNPGVVTYDDHPFSIDDKVMNLRNCSWPAVVRDENVGEDAPVEKRYEISDEFSYYVANGEIGRVFHAEPKMVWVRFDHDRLCHYPKQWLKNLTLAYAITGHKSQGSQWPVVIIAMEEPKDASFLCNRSWIYTAISRAAKLCLVFGQPNWIRNYIKKEATVKRKTLLKERLWHNHLSWSLDSL